MSEYLIQDTTLTAIADAIREKTGGTDQMTPDQMATEISNIQASGGGDDSSLKGIIERTVTNPTLPGDLTKIGNYVFYYYTSLNLACLPEGITSIGDYAFAYCKNLALTSLPAGITIIGMDAFHNCTNLALTSLPAGITIVNNNSFNGCTGLTSITFEGTPTEKIASNAFKGCTNLTSINVPWAEGAVANAPWGATNATINYNYTGE